MTHEDIDCSTCPWSYHLKGTRYCVQYNYGGRKRLVPSDSVRGNKVCEHRNKTDHETEMLRMAKR